MKLPTRLTLEMAQRILADIVMINLALITAFILRFVSFFVFQDPGSPLPYSDLFRSYVRAYLDLSWFLTLICFIVFYSSGFYTYGRAYRSRYKALLILQAVSLSYLIFGFSTYFIWGQGVLPRTVLIMAWLLSLLLIGGLRVGSALSRRTVWAEAKIWGKPPRRTIRNVLVIGGAGYIGSVLVRKLLESGFYVSVLDSLLYGDESIRDLTSHPNFELIYGDIRHIEPVVRAMQHSDAVVHLAALVGDPVCSLDEKLTLEINLAATRMIAESARGVGAQRFIFASTCSVYGASDQILDEHSTLNPVSLYARTKIDSERLLLTLNDERFSPVILRFATVYGLSPRPRFDLVINLMTARAVREKRIVVFGGSQWRPFIHVADAAQAIINCLQAPLNAVKGQIFNVGSDEQNYQISRIGEIIKELMPDVEVIHQGETLDKRNYRVSFAKIRKYLGFVPRHTVVQGVLEIKEALENGLIQDYQDARYSNYKTLSEKTHLGLVLDTYFAPLYSCGTD